MAETSTSSRKRSARRKTAREDPPLQAGQARIRHYCQGIGDSHLLQFAGDDGRPFFMLIDCGVHSSVKGGSDMIRRIAADIASVTRHIDVLVVTHEHWDHVSGFLTAAEEFAGITVDEVWLSWAENPADPQARQLDQFKQQALAALQGMTGRLDATVGLSGHLLGLREGLHAMLGFSFGAKGERVRAARDAAVSLARHKVRYLEPGEKPELQASLAPQLRIYVLGPPRDAALLRITERSSEMYGAANDPALALALALQGGLGVDGDVTGSADSAAPFDANVGVPLSQLLEEPHTEGEDAELHSLRGFLQAHYAGPVPATPVRPRKRSASSSLVSQDWRRIDSDWLGAAADLAMQLDHRTNNTSLVLAFEFIGSGRVLLFAADAQVGNWLSWHDLHWPDGEGRSTTVGDLLARTVYYKVAHHGSENATLKAKGLELMSHPDLSAFVPTNALDARKVKWNKIPFSGILDALHGRTQGRVIRADDQWIAGDLIDQRFQQPSGSLFGVRHQPSLWVEVLVS